MVVLFHTPSQSSSLALSPLRMALFIVPRFCPLLSPVAKYELAAMGFVVDGLFSGGAADDFILTAHCCTTVPWLVITAGFVYFRVSSAMYFPERHFRARISSFHLAASEF